MTTKKATKTTKADQAKVIDPLATSPSNGPKAEDTSTVTEPNSMQRVAEKTTRRSGRNNGGDGSSGPARPGLNTDLTGDTLGEREAVSPADTDALWTNASKDKWGNGQPEFADLLKQRDAIENGVVAEAEPEKTDD